jgi:hypothetical protein
MVSVQIFITVKLGNALENIWMDAIVTSSRYYPNIFLELLRKTTTISARCVPTEIRTEHSQNTSLK